MPYSMDSKLDEFVQCKAIQLDQFVSNKKGKENPLVGLGKAIVATALRYQLNPIYILAHAIWESGWGQSSIFQKKNNLFGWGASDDAPMQKAWDFVCPEHCIYEVMRRIKIKFFILLNHNTLKLMNDTEPKYASDKNWKNGILLLMNQIEESINQQT